MNILIIASRFPKEFGKAFAKHNYLLEVVSSPQEGISLAKAQYFDLIILDLQASKDGPPAIQAIRAKQIRTPILCLGKRDSAVEVARALNSGSDGYLIKPFLLPELFAYIRAMMRRCQTPRGMDLHYADLRLDPVTRKAWRSGQDIKLTTKEYQLLKYLLENAEQLVTRKMIVVNAWDTSANCLVSLINCYVTYLRNKIDKGFSQSLIHTVRGKGYILTENL